VIHASCASWDRDISSSLEDKTSSISSVGSIPEAASNLNVKGCFEVITPPRDLIESVNKIWGSTAFMWALFIFENLSY
jgi:hypothetical protein